MQIGSDAFIWIGFNHRYANSFAHPAWSELCKIEYILRSGLVVFKISAVANLSPTDVILTFAVCPVRPLFTKITNPCTLAIPSPFLLISVICTSYSLPVSTGFALLSNPPASIITSSRSVAHL